MHCHVCQNATRPEDISLLGIQICTDCESKFVNLDVNDPAYDQMIDKIRDVWKAIVKKKGD